MSTNKRTSLAAIARQTQEIIERGGYVLGGDGPGRARAVDLSAAVARAVASTSAYSPADVERLVAERRAASAGAAPPIEITGETSLEAARRLGGAGGRVGVLNFASAKNPGGGFLAGARAQEESLCRASALYATLLAQPRYYEANRASHDLHYTDHAIHSPDVPVIRGDGGELLEAPFPVSFITMPAPNRGAMREPDDGAIRRTFLRRIAAVLAIAARHGHDTLVLGAWGCGAFRNDPAVVAGAFRAVLDEAALAAPFQRIVFAIFEARSDHGNRAAFEAAFAR